MWNENRYVDDERASTWTWTLNFRAMMKLYAFNHFFLYPSFQSIAEVDTCPDHRHHDSDPEAKFVDSRSQLMLSSSRLNNFPGACVLHEHAKGPCSPSQPKVDTTSNALFQYNPPLALGAKLPHNKSCIPRRNLAQRIPHTRSRNRQHQFSFAPSRRDIRPHMALRNNETPTCSPHSEMFWGSLIQSPTCHFPSPQDDR